MWHISVGKAWSLHQNKRDKIMSLCSSWLTEIIVYALLLSNSNYVLLCDSLWLFAWELQGLPAFFGSQKNARHLKNHIFFAKAFFVPLLKYSLPLKSFLKTALYHERIEQKCSDTVRPIDMRHTWTETRLNPTWVYLGSKGTRRTPLSRASKWAPTWYVSRLAPRSL